jgi:hypothetical protein
VTGAERIPHGSDRLKLGSAGRCVNANAGNTTAAPMCMTLLDDAAPHEV